MRYSTLLPPDPLVTALNARDTSLASRLTEKIHRLNTQILEVLEQQPTFTQCIQDAFNQTFAALPTPVTMTKTYLRIDAASPVDPSDKPAQASSDDIEDTVLDVQPLLPTLMDAVVRRIVTQTPANHAGRTTTFHLSSSGEDSAPDLGLTPAAFDAFLNTLAGDLATRFKAHQAAFWNGPAEDADIRTCQQWLGEKRLELMKAEIELLKVDGRVVEGASELLLMQVARTPDALSRQALKGDKPCAYAIAVRDKLSSDIPLYGAFVITSRDHETPQVRPQGEVQTPEARDVTPQANVGPVLLFLPASGFEGFDSMAGLDLELHRRLNSPLEFSDILALMNENDRASGLAFHQQQNLSGQFRYTERLTSIFSDAIDSLRTQVDENFSWMVAHYQRHASDVDITQLPESLDRTTTITPAFDAAGWLAARQRKKARRQLQHFLKAATPDDKQQWEQAVQAYVEHLLRLSGPEALPSLSQYSDPATLLAYSNEQLRRMLEAEHGLAVDPDDILIHTKTYAPRLIGGYVAGGKPHPSTPGTPVFTTRQLTLTELALENIEWLDLNFTNFSRLTDKAQTPFTGLSVAQVKDLVRTLNIGDSYEQFLKARLITSPSAQAEQQRYMEVMALQLRVDAVEAKIAGDFLADRLDRGFNWVMSVLAGPTDDDKRARVEGHRVVVSALKLRGERVRGVLVFSTASQAVASRVVYTPRSPNGRLFHEYPDASAMHRDFINHSAWQDYLVGRVTLTAQRRIRGLLKDGANDPVIALTRIAGNVLEEAYQTEASAVINDANAQSTSTHEADYESATTLITAGLDLATAFFPVKVMLPIGLARSSLSVINAVEAAQLGDRASAAHYIVRALGELVGAVLDGAVAGAGSARPRTPTSARPRLDPKMALKKTPTDVKRLQGWEAEHIYVRDVVEAGTYQAPQHFLEEHGHWYSIVRDSDAQVWRLKDPRRAPSAYKGQPLYRNPQGLWEIRSPHLGLRGGAPFATEPQRALMDLYPYMDVEQARRVLDSFVFPRHRELELQTALVQHLRRSPTRLDDFSQYLMVTPQRFRLRLEGRDLPGSQPSAVEPVPGPSRAPTEPDLLPAPRPPRPPEERFVDWGQSFDASVMEAVAGRPGVWRKRDAPPGQRSVEYIQMEGRYYATLPGSESSAVAGARAVIVPSDRPCSTFVQFEDLLHRYFHDQPRIVEYNASLDRWLIGAQLPFRAPVARQLSHIFPSFTPHSLTRLAAALFNRSNPTGLNAGGYARLLRTLHDWTSWSGRAAAAPGGSPLTLVADPLALLHRLPQTPDQRAWPLVPSAQFNLLRFRTERMPATLTANAAVMPNAATARNLMRALLSDSHYHVVDTRYPSELLVRREGRPTLYWLTIIRTNSDHVLTRHYNPHSPTAFNLQRQSANVRALAHHARRDGHLVALIGGVQPGEGATVIPFIFRP
ncbi:dermonecrotic toxin domain-containing protein [Pseudomonas cedrina]|uniref:dermonecrotic toxin domain-containing protein n=1 Tax=Pseudomonas cedrina TaxID=651740 RepID=UPI00277E640B|nr:DUF6543 domain-containing protein [Pseudomonas cedrina]MDQ0654982.1 hypothetical protein [Pseudomonas cedrina]